MDATQKAEIAQRLSKALLDYLDCMTPEPPSAESKKLYTPQELSDMFGVKPSTINGKIKAGEFGETVNFSERRRYVTEEGLQKYITEHKGSPYTPRQRRSKTTMPVPGRITGRI